MKTLLLFLLLSTSLFASHHPPSWKDKARVQALNHADFLLYWGLCKKPALSTPQHDLSSRESLSLNWPALTQFAQNHHYFSLSAPLIGIVSSSSSDLSLVKQLLLTPPETINDPVAFDLALAEVLTKILAYRDLSEGKTLLIPQYTSSGVVLETFTVDKIFNLWNGMPAFGLVPTSPHAASILLFRGTDFSLITKRGLSSLISDLDPKGPGLRAFLNARKPLHTWLKKVHAEGKSARVMGFSLGGALATYTFIYYNDLLSSTPSVALCPPGISNRILKAFHILPASRQSLLLTYINAGDIVSQIGHLTGSIYLLSSNESLKPLAAHTSLLSIKTPLYRLSLR